MRSNKVTIRSQTFTAKMYDFVSVELWLVTLVELPRRIPKGEGLCVSFVSPEVLFGTGYGCVLAKDLQHVGFPDDFP